MSAQPIQEPVEVLLIVQYALLRESLGRLLSTGLGFNVAGQCASFKEALDMLKQGSIEVVLLDLDLGKQPAQQFVRAARRQGFRGKVLLLASDVNQGDIADFIRVGICGIFRKSDPGALLGHVIRDVIDGNVWFKQEQLQSALNPAAATTSDIHNNGFTKRERSVLSLVSEGLTNREIGAQIGISEGSVKAALQQLFAKFGVRSRSRLVRITMEQQQRKAQTISRGA